jgi:putative transferase (TIGR04331 family)
VTYNGTTYLETFAANYPTLLYWNPMHWEVREEVKPYFNNLVKVGILHYTPESLASKINEIYSDPLFWWKQQEIQITKDDFCRQFANKAGDLKINIENEIMDFANARR